MKKVTYLILLLCLLVSNQAIYGQTTSDSTSKKVKPDGVAINKGTMFLGGTIQLNSKKSDNTSFLVTSINEKEKSTMDISIYYGYAIKKNFCLGMGLNYGNERLNQLVTNNSGIQSHVQFANNSYGFRPLLKNFIPIDKKDRFYLFTQTQLFYDYSQGLTQIDSQGELTRIINKTNSFGFQLEPGITAFLVRNFALEVSVPLAGFKSKHTLTQTTNEPDSHTHSNNIDFKINVLQVNLGLYGYF